MRLGAKKSAMKYRAPMTAFLIDGIALMTAPRAQSPTPPAPQRSADAPPQDRTNGAGTGTGTATPPAAPSTKQLAKLKAVLAPYNPATLKPDDAKAIKRALRHAGLRPGPALDKALADAGFSALRLEALEPRPPLK